MAPAQSEAPPGASTAEAPAPAPTMAPWRPVSRLVMLLAFAVVVGLAYTYVEFWTFPQVGIVKGRLRSCIHSHPSPWAFDMPYLPCFHRLLFRRYIDSCPSPLAI
jgi:hypothetical protein